MGLVARSGASPLASVHPTACWRCRWKRLGREKRTRSSGPGVIEAARKQSHLSGEYSGSPTAAGNYNYV